MNEVYIQFVSTVGAVAFIGICVFMWRLVTKFEPILEFIKRTEDRLDDVEDRLSVHDSLWSQQLKQIVRSDLIAKGREEWPKVKIPKYEN